ncbi:MAG: GNAT family N-acetyltransferase [Lachnospiraceae bacterium]|nr:GNAT family N-acetyltransferase [Lachnospiraceae bacterium]
MEQTSVIIRPASLEDAKALQRIYAYYVEHTVITFEYEVPTVKEFRDRMAKIMEKYPYLVAELEGRPVGYAYAGTFKTRAAYDWAVETTVYIDRELRGRGAGRQLYEALEAALRDMGIVNMYACIGYPEQEDEYLTRTSAEFHEHMGFTLVGRFSNCGYKFGRWYHMIWMEKIIGDHVDDQPTVRFLKKEMN